MFLGYEQERTTSRRSRSRAAVPALYVALVGSVAGMAIATPAANADTIDYTVSCTMTQSGGWMDAPFPGFPPGTGAYYTGDPNTVRLNTTSPLSVTCGGSSTNSNGFVTVKWTIKMNKTTAVPYNLDVTASVWAMSRGMMSFPTPKMTCVVNRNDSYFSGSVPVQNQLNYTLYPGGPGQLSYNIGSLTSTAVGAGYIGAASNTEEIDVYQTAYAGGDVGGQVTFTVNVTPRS